MGGERDRELGVAYCRCGDAGGNAAIVRGDECDSGNEALERTHALADQAGLARNTGVVEARYRTCLGK